MKDQILPEIPQQSMPHAQSMYEQLRKTSQKWFSTAGSHRRIFTNSALSPRGDLGERMAQGRMVEVMREQIQIAVREYGGRMKGVLQEQARKIKLLGDLLLKNQMELGRKEKTIETLASMIEQRNNQDRKQSLAGIDQKIIQNQQKLISLQHFLQMTQQDGPAGRLKTVQRQYKQKLTRLSQSYARKIGQLSEQFEQRIDKVQKVIVLTNAPPKNTFRSSSKDPSFTQSLQNLKAELQDLRQQVDSFKRKKYKYENYKLQEVRNQIETIRQQLHRHQQHCRGNLHTSKSPNLKASATTHATRTDLQQHPSQTSKTRFLNKYKSLISPRPHPDRQRKQSCSSSSSSHSDVEQIALPPGGNIGRLRTIIAQAGLGIPLRIQIDQTGYAKSTDTGMYLVDTLGNGFQFTPQEIAQLRKEGLIAL